MTDPVTRLRWTLAGAGFSPLPCCGKRPVMSGWADLGDASDDEIAGWIRRWPSATNTGILTRRTPTLDIDIKNAAAAGDVERLVAQTLARRGRLLVRIGQPPKRAIPLRVAKPFKKIKLTFEGGDGVELLGD